MNEDVKGSIMAYLDYVRLKIKKEPDYDAHPIIKAMMMMVTTNHGEKNGKYCAVSGNGNTEKGIEPTELYSVVMEKKEDKFELRNITDLINRTEIDIYDALLLIELSLKLEKIDSEFVSAKEIEKLMNEVFQSKDFIVVCPKNYIEARDYFKDMLQKGQIKIPFDKDIKEGLLKIKTYTKWHDYPQKVRSLIAVVWGAQNNKQAISLESNEMPKHKVIDIFKVLFTSKFKEITLSHIKNSKEKKTH